MRRALLLALAVVLSPPCPASSRETEIDAEGRALADALPRAYEGDPEAIGRLLGLASGSYIDTGEGGEYLNEIYLELLVGHPVVLAESLAIQTEDVRHRVVRELSHPVTDRFATRELLTAARTARRGDENSASLEELVRGLEELERQERANRVRGDLSEAVRACLHWGGEEPYDDARARQIEEGWKRDCAVAVRRVDEALRSYPGDGYFDALAVVLVGYHGGPPSIADGLMGSPSDWARRCDRATRETRELERWDLYQDLVAYVEPACGITPREASRY